MISAAVAGAGIGTGKLLARTTQPPATVAGRPFHPLTPEQNGQRVKVTSDGQRAAPILGDPKAPLAVMVFSDLECPSARQHAPTLSRLAAEYPGRVKVVYRHFPMHDRLSAEAAEAAREQGKFWELYERLRAAKSGLQRPEVEREAQAAGLDVARFARALDAERTRRRVDRDITDAWEVGVVGTPTTLVNGRVLVGARPYQELKKLVDEELEAAQRRPG